MPFKHAVEENVMSLFAHLSEESRKRKLRLFHDLVAPMEKMRILDVGAEIDPEGKKSLQLIDSYPWKHRLSAINLSSKHISAIKQHYPQVEAVVGDALELPWPDKHFDAVYSNAVIEHLGTFEKQQRMASEIMRVGKVWFVTTPNRWFPFEFHMRLPLVTWLPAHGYLLAGRLISYNHVTRRYTRGFIRRNLRLMTASELRRCFPKSTVLKQSVTFMAETLNVFGPDACG